MSDDLNASAENGRWRNVGVDAFASRSDVLKRAAVAGGAVVAGGLLIAGLPKVAASARSRAQDVRILNYLLRLEYVMAAFYETAATEGHLTGEINSSSATRTFSVGGFSIRSRINRSAPFQSPSCL